MAPPRLQPTIYTGTFIHTPAPSTLSILANTSVYVSGDGIITHIQPSSSPAPPGYESGHVIAAQSEHQFFFPGFIDTHIHASQYANAGIFGTSTLLDWLTRYTFPLESSLSNPDKARCVYSRCISRTLANGTTTAAYYATLSAESTNILADLCYAAGQRAFVGRCCMDQNSPEWYTDSSISSALKDTEATIKHCRGLDPQGEKLSPIVTPRFGPSCSKPMLEALGQLAQQEKLPVQTHVSENVNEVKWVRELFPESESYAAVYRDAGLLSAGRAILAHAVHLTDDEVDILKQHDAGISHCPVSNLSLGSGAAKVKKLLRGGLKVGLGTDVGGGYAPSVLESVRQATLVSNLVALETGNDEDKIGIAEALYLGTRGGAQVVGMEHMLGVFGVGMQWDAMLVCLGRAPEAHGAGNGLVKPTAVKDNPVDVFGWENWEEKVAKWVYAGDERNIESVWVAGRPVHTSNGSV